MKPKWQKVAHRAVEGLDVQPGELIEVRDHAGVQELSLEILLAVERLGATPLFQHQSREYLERLWVETPVQALEQWDRRRLELLAQVDRILVLGGPRADRHLAPPSALDAWHHAIQRLTLLEEQRRLPYLVMAVPTPQGARQLGWAPEDLEALLLPALAVPVVELRAEIRRVLNRMEGGKILTLHSGDNHVLRLDHGDRAWMSDDGKIDRRDRRLGAIVSNLPAGSIYTTVLEDRTQGSLWLPKAGPATGVTLHFQAGRIVEIEAEDGAGLLVAELDSHTGEPRRVSHIGLGLNPHLHRQTGWTLVDEHIHGSLFLALGENRYMGGLNVSSLNEDYALHGVSLQVDGRSIVAEGRLAG